MFGAERFFILSQTFYRLAEKYLKHRSERNINIMNGLWRILNDEGCLGETPV